MQKQTKQVIDENSMIIYLQLQMTVSWEEQGFRVFVL